MSHSLDSRGDSRYNFAMNSSSMNSSRSLALATNTESQIYALFALAVGLTCVGVYFGMIYAATLLGTGVAFLMVLAEFALILTSGWWSRQSPLNILLFALFPLLSGITVTPYLMAVLVGYTNGASILMNALLATVFMTGASAVLARLSGWNLSGLGRSLLFSLLGLIGIGILQIFIPSFREGPVELLVSGAGVVVFGLFTAYDLQRIVSLGRMGGSPFVLALSLYLDIFNLFLSIVRFIVAISGNRR